MVAGWRASACQAMVACRLCGALGLTFIGNFVIYHMQALDFTLFGFTLYYSTQALDLYVSTQALGVDRSAQALDLTFTGFTVYSKGALDFTLFGFTGVYSTQALDLTVTGLTVYSKWALGFTLTGLVVYCSERALDFTLFGFTGVYSTQALDLAFVGGVVRLLTRAFHPAGCSGYGGCCCCSVRVLGLASRSSALSLWARGGGLASCWTQGVGPAARPSLRSFERCCGTDDWMGSVMPEMLR